MTNNLPKKNKSDILIYQIEDGQTRIDVQLIDETVWLTQKLMAELFQVAVPTINEHLKNIFNDLELKKESVIRKSRITAADGKSYKTNFYNLEAILSVGYRVRSHRGTQFRIWATQRLKEYLIKGFVMDDERLKNPGQIDYFDEPCGYCTKIIYLYLSMRRHGGTTATFYLPLAQINLRDDLSACVHVQAGGMSRGDYAEKLTYLLILREVMA